MSLHRSFLCILILAVAAAAESGQAGVGWTVFTERDAWQAAAGITAVEDFDEAPLQWLMAGPSFTFSAHQIGKLTVGAKGDYLGPDNNPTIRDASDALSPNGTRHLGGALFSVELVMEMSLGFSRPVRAFGADWASAANRAGVTLSIGGKQLALADHLPNDGHGFFGVVTADPFAEVLVTTRAFEDYGLDNVSFSAPEPAAATYLLTSGLAIGSWGSCCRRRRKGRAVAAGNCRRLWSCLGKL